MDKKLLKLSKKYDLTLMISWSPKGSILTKKIDEDLKWLNKNVTPSIEKAFWTVYEDYLEKVKNNG